MVPQAATKLSMAGNLAIAMLWIVRCVVGGIGNFAIIPPIDLMLACIMILAGRTAIARKMVCDALVLRQSLHVRDEENQNLVSKIRMTLTMASVAIAMVNLVWWRIRNDDDDTQQHDYSNHSNNHNKNEYRRMTRRRKEQRFYGPQHPTEEKDVEVI